MANVLLVVTSHAVLGNSSQPTGVWLEELAQAYYAFEEAGHAVRIASPAGGPAPLDPASTGEPWLSPLGTRFLGDAAAVAKLRGTERIDAVASTDVDALYVVGGAGAVIDLPRHGALGRLLEALAASRKPVAAVCHGAAALVAARNPDGTPMVSGRAVTAFSNVEEEQVGYVPYLAELPENLLREAGAAYTCGAPWAEHVVVDGLLFSGQNPASAGPLARAVATRLAAR